MVGFFFLSKRFPACLAAEILQFYASACGQRTALNRNRWAMYANRSNEMETNEFAVTQESHHGKARGWQGTQRSFPRCRGLPHANGRMWGKKDSSGVFARNSLVPQHQCAAPDAVRTFLDENQNEMLVFLWLVEILSPCPARAYHRLVKQSTLQVRSEASGFNTS